MRKIKLCLVSCLVLLYSAQVFAQERTITGTVTDQEGNPIEGIRVELIGEGTYTQTDVEGKYKIKIPSGHPNTLSFSHPDNVDASVSVGLHNNIDVILANPGEDIFDMSLEDLLNINVVTASKKSEKQTDAPGIISVLTKDDLVRFGGTSLKDILERVPGLISSSVFFVDATTLAARGDQIKNTSGHILMLINGRPVRETQDGGINSDFYNSFPVDVIEKIEVIKGPGSVLYGSDAFSAVINIITLQPEANNIALTALGTNDKGYGTSVGTVIKKGNLGIVAGGRFMDKPWERTKTSTSQFTMNDTSISSSIPDQSIGGYLEINYKNLRVMSSYNNWKTSPVQSTGESTWEKLFANLGYNLKINDSWDMDLNATYTTTENAFPVSTKTSNNFVGEWTNFIVLGHKVEFVLGSAYNRIEGKETSKFDLGNFNGDKNDSTSTEQANTSSGGSVVAEGTKNNLSMYAQLDYQLFDNVKLIGGIQMNKAEGIAPDLVPRVGLIWYPIQKLNIKALYSSAFRAPSITELYLNSGGVNGNSELLPEKVATVDLGITYSSEHGQIGVNVFHSKMTDIISIVNSVYSNNTTITFNGAEISSQYYLNRNLYLNASLLYQENKNDTTDNVSYVSNLGAKAGISYTFTKGVTLSLFDIYQGKMDDKFSGNLDSGNDLAYNLLHLHSHFDINKLFGLNFKPQFTLYFNIDNLLDQKYYAYNELNSVALASSGRRIYLGLKVVL